MLLGENMAPIFMTGWAKVLQSGTVEKCELSLPKNFPEPHSVLSLCHSLLPSSLTRGHGTQIEEGPLTSEHCSTEQQG